MAGMRRSLQELSAEVATNPNSTAFVELAVAYRERGDLERAARLCLRGLERHPTHVEAHYELGRIYEASGERDLALDEWMIVRQLAPEHVPACCASVRLYLEEGRVEDARRDLERVRSLAPNDPAVRSLVKQFEAGAGAGAGAGADNHRRAASANGPAAKRQKGWRLEAPGALGVLLVGEGGEVEAGRMSGQSASNDRVLAGDLSGARSEAERVAAYLNLGAWKGMLVESSSARISVSPVGAGVIIVATAPEMPAGQAARVAQRARQRAQDHFQSDER